MLKNKIIFITGGSTGIGLDCAKAYVAEGATVAMVALDGDETACQALVKPPVVILERVKVTMQLMPFVVANFATNAFMSESDHLISRLGHFTKRTDFL